MSSPDTANPEAPPPASGPANAELSHHQYEFNNKLLVRNCKHLQNRQQEQQKQNFQRNGYQSKRNYSKEDYVGNNDDNLSRGLSLESYNSLYEAELNSWPRHTQHNQQQQHLLQQIKFDSINNIKQAYGGSNTGISNQNGSICGKLMADGGHRMNGLNGQHLNAATKGTATTPTFQHIIYNNETYETHLTHRQHPKEEDDDDHDDDDADIDNMAKTALASNKTYKKFVLPLDIPTPPLPLSYNTTKRLLSSHNHHTQTSSATCQCDKQTNFALQPHNNCSISTNSNNNNNNNNSNIKNQVNHISFIQTTPTQTPPSKKENLKLLHNKGSSSSSTLSGSIGCGALNFNVSDQHLPHHEPLQHHHLCQQKNLKLQHATHQHHHHHHQQLQQQQQHHSQPHCQQKLQHQQLPSYDAYASQHYLPQLPQLLSINSSNQQNSLTLSHRRMAPTFNRIADKNYMKNLVYSPAKLRRVRIILCVVGGIVLLALLGTAIYFIVSGSEDGTNSGGNGNGGPSNGIHLEDVLQGKLVARHFNGSWSGNNIIYKENN
ncbi:protein kinase 4-like, partial [Lucilia sericata]|uniref:protein kinase 4-like n=1 Tax=Lucilia sericata TaxID=13632 RepID=UPI0018A87FC0